MGKLYPPIISGTLPAFCLNYKENEDKIININTDIKIPFQMNRGVGKDQIQGFYLKIKTVQNSRLISTLYSSDIDFKNNIVIFNYQTLVEENKLNVGQHYKMQIAYVESGSGIVGHYSTIGIIKCTTKPKLEIYGLNSEQDNLHQYNYMGIYSQRNPEREINDLAEKLYSYRFNIYESKEGLIYESDWIIHNSSQDVNAGESLCAFSFNKDLESNKRYKIKFEILTNNNLYDSVEYNLIQRQAIQPEVDFKVFADADSMIEEGGVIIRLKDADNIIRNEKLYTGSFKLLRTDEESGFTEWGEIMDFKLFKQEAPEILFIDYTVKQGIKYKYAIVQCNIYNLQSNRIESNIVQSNFEYIYLFDGERQLKIKYNPKISSFKETLLETKMDTIGNKHPFIFRNGNVAYKEFPISGLISSLSDENRLFFTFRKEKQNPNRIYEEYYRAIKVDKNKYYYYDEEWNKLYIKGGTSSKPKWLTIYEYCKLNNLSIDKGYSSSISYYIRELNPNYNPATHPISNKYKYISVKVSDHKIYYFPEVKEKLYINKEDKFIKLKDKASYNSTEKYYLQFVKTKHLDNIEIQSFANHYNFDSILTERDFKLEVLDWLNNGKPKLFRSATEGNYIVRLMNSSLTPNDQLGRILHTFNSTAYEVNGYSFENLKNNGFIIYQDPTIKTIRWKTVKLEENNINTNLIDYKTVGLRFEGMTPGDLIYINDGIKRQTGYDNEYQVGYKIVIGATGSYNLDLNSNVKITEIRIESHSPIIQGQLTYAYETAAFSSFDTIETFEVKTTPLKQFFGSYQNIINEINDIKNQLQNIYFIHAILREELDIYAQYDRNHQIAYYTRGRNGQIVFDSSEINYNQIAELGRHYIYNIYKLDGQTNEYKISERIDGYTFESIFPTEEEIEYSDKIIINGEYDEITNKIEFGTGVEIQVFNDNDFFLKETEMIKSIWTGYRILFEICHQNTITTYAIEEVKDEAEDSVYNLKREYENAIIDYKQAAGINDDKELDANSQTIKSLKDLYIKEKNIENKYKAFINALNKELENQRRIEGERVS